MPKNLLKAVKDFNTSHVNVNQVECHQIRHKRDFNTSHVNVNQVLGEQYVPFTRFQYISC